jgi:hypothetical protein
MRRDPLLAAPSALRRCRPTLAVLALASLAAAGPACLACNEPACVSAFEWNAEADDGSALLPGAYAFEVTLEGSRYSFECTVVATARESSCSEPARVEGDVDFDLYVDVVSLQLDPDQWDRDAPAASFSLRASDESESDPSRNFNATRGPQDVHIVTLHDGAPLIDVEYMLTYERNDEFYGDERCGYCDEQQRRDAHFTQ